MVLIINLNTYKLLDLTNRLIKTNFKKNKSRFRKNILTGLVGQKKKMMCWPEVF